MKKKTITMRALTQRLNRALAKKGQKLEGDKSGAYSLIDVKKSSVIAESADLNKLAEELNVLKPWEHVEL
jgi:hypothetical protein